MNIGERIRQRRKELKYSVDYVAEKLGKNRATVYRYESDEIENMPIDVIKDLAKVLNTSPACFEGKTLMLQVKQNVDFTRFLTNQ